MRRLGLILGTFVFAATMSDRSDAGFAVTETTTGSSGNYVLNFSVTNTLGGTNDIYFFGVATNAGNNEVGIPAGWTNFGSFNPSVIGGPNITYDNTFLVPSGTGPAVIVPGATLGGFQVGYSGATLPASVQFLGLADNGTYTGGDNFGTQTNPGFSGEVDISPTAVPEPSSLALCGVAATVGLGIARARRKRTVA